MKKVFIIMHKGSVYLNMFFLSEEEARNFVKMKNPNRRFKEVERNEFTCTRYGTIFKVQSLNLQYSKQGELLTEIVG